MKLYCSHCLKHREVEPIQVTDFFVRTNTSYVIKLEAILVINCKTCGAGLLYHKAIGTLTLEHRSGGSGPNLEIESVRFSNYENYLRAFDPDYKLKVFIAFACNQCGLKWRQTWDYEVGLTAFQTTPIRIELPDLIAQATRDDSFLAGERFARFN